MQLRFTQRQLDAWAQKWPCSTLVPGTAYFDAKGDLVALSGKLEAADVDGREFDAFVNDHQPPELRQVRGSR